VGGVGLGAPRAGDAVAEPDRDRLLSPAWRGSADLAWTTSGDARGFHLLVAEARQGYAWRTVATLSEPGIPTDQWIGNACLTGSGRRAVLVYAPRHFSNRDHLFGRGGFAAVVDLATGAVTKLDVGASLAYYDPGCGVGETAVLTQSAAIESGRTRLHLLDAARGTVTRRHELPGQVTSAVPVGAGIVAASGAKLIDVAADGRQRTLAVTRGVPFEVHPDAAGGVTFLDQPDGSTAAVNSLSGGRMRELGRGRLSEVGLVAGTGGRTFVTGEVPALADPPAGMRRLEVDAHAGVSSHGGLAVLRKGPLASAGAADPADPAGGPAPVNLQATVTATGRSVEFRAPVGMRPPEPSAAGAAPSCCGS
jgi:hypothetical protein